MVCLLRVFKKYSCATKSRRHQRIIIDVLRRVRLKERYALGLRQRLFLPHPSRERGSRSLYLERPQAFVSWWLNSYSICKNYAKSYHFLVFDEILRGYVFCRLNFLPKSKANYPIMSRHMTIFVKNLDAHSTINAFI